MRLGIFGGTFDPVHYGHLLLAEQAREAYALDRVVFIPAACPPHKKRQPRSAVAHRLTMVELAVAGNDAFCVSDMEIARGGTSYSVDTVQRLADDNPQAELFFLIGSDTVPELPTWKDAGRLAELATLIVVCRPGAPLPPAGTLAGTLTHDQVRSLGEHVVSMPLTGLASRDIRQRVAGGQSIRYMVPPSVAHYIDEHGLDRDQSCGSGGGCTG